MSLTQNKQALFETKNKGSSTKPISSASVPSTSEGKQAVTIGLSLAADKRVQKDSNNITTGSATKSISISSLSTEAKNKRLAEAKDLSDRATQSLKTSIFQWKPDHLLASSLFEQAAEKYKTAGELKMSVALLIQAAESHEACGASAATALTLGKACDLASLAGETPTRIVHLLSTAADSWAAHGDMFRYSETLAKIAKELQEINAEKAKAKYWQAINVLCPDSTTPEQMKQTHSFIIDLTRDALAFFLRKQFLLDGHKLARKIAAISQAFEIESSMCKALLAQCIIQIALGDPVKAHQDYLQDLSNSSYLRSKESEVADLLVMACMQQDADLLDRARQHPHLLFIDKELQNIVRNISLFTMLDTEPTHSISGANVVKLASPTVPPQDVDNFDMNERRDMHMKECSSQAEPEIDPVIDPVESQADDDDEIDLS